MARFGPRRLIAIVGPSGVGKDSVMTGLRKAHPEIAMIRRIITRPSESGGEDFDGATDVEFDDRVAAGHFAMFWPAHGLRYGIPNSELSVLATRDAVINLSRQVLFEASQIADLRVFNLTAPVDVLAGRLAARGRESATDIVDRLARARFEIDPRVQVVDVANDGPLDRAVTAISRALYDESGMRCKA